jgi:CRISPR/Cas system Type II protein with McrA/HNH and RuvC-like nuclease domain
MSSFYLNGLPQTARQSLVQQLWEQQNGKCFISEKPIELDLDDVDIDHIIPTRDNGKAQSTSEHIASGK